MLCATLKNNNKEGVGKDLNNKQQQQQIVNPLCFNNDEYNNCFYLFFFYFCYPTLFNIFTYIFLDIYHFRILFCAHLDKKLLNALKWAQSEKKVQMSWLGIVRVRLSVFMCLAVAVAVCAPRCVCVCVSLFVHNAAGCLPPVTITRVTICLSREGRHAINTQSRLVCPLIHLYTHSGSDIACTNTQLRMNAIRERERVSSTRPLPAAIL